MTTPTKSAGCHYCGTTEKELRPYGPGGDPICFPCMKATPEREAAAGSSFSVLLDANRAISPSGLVAIGTEDGPVPFTIPIDGTDQPPGEDVP